MLPEENKNNIGLNTFKVGIDPVFKGNNGSQRNAVDQVNPTGAYEVLSNQEYIPSQTTAPTPLNSTTNKTPKTVIRTYKDDLEAAIQNNHFSSINIAIAENEKLHKQNIIRQEETTTGGVFKKMLIIFFLILTFAGAAGISTYYFINRQNSAVPVAKIKELTSLITTEYKDELNIDTIIKDSFANVLSSKLNDVKIPMGGLYNAYIITGSSTKRLVDASEFISLMKFQMPDIAKRTLLPNFMVGMYSFDRNLPFIILKTSSFENTYTGMLGWESYLQKDFAEIFRLPGYKNGGGIISALTPTSANKFGDGTILNKDVRVLRNDSNDIILLYGIIDKETIIITVNDFVFKEIISRLNKEKTLRR